MAASEDARWLITNLSHADKWREAIDHALASLAPSEVVTCAGTSSWIRGSEPEPCSGSYYFVTDSGLHYGCDRTEKKRLSSKRSCWDVFVSRSDIAYVRTDGRYGVQFHRADGESLALIWFDEISDQFLRQDDAPSSWEHHWEQRTPFEKVVNVARALGMERFENDREPAAGGDTPSGTETPAEYERRFGTTYNERLAATLGGEQTRSRASANANLLVARMLLDEGKHGTDELAEVILWAHLADASLGYREIAAELGMEPESVSQHLVAAASSDETRWPPGADTNT